jgi:ferredoxin
MVIWILVGIAWIGSLGGFCLISVLEKEPQAAIRAGLLALAGGIGFAAVTLLPAYGQWIILGFLIFACLAGVVIFFLPIGRRGIIVDTPTRQFDERDVIFSRARLEPGSYEFISYYQMRPENQKNDDRFRSLPGLLSPQAKFAQPFQFASAKGSFGLTDVLRESVDNQPAAVKQEMDNKQLTKYVKWLAHYYGALDVGITELKPYHIYSHVGRGTGTYGEVIELPHSYAIAFTVEMSYEMVRNAPRSSISMESAHQYVEAAQVAIQLSNTLGELGYAARAHIDGNYRVIAPLVARDAGLGEIGRMSILMTPRQGPRVRLGVVTTDIPLVPDRRRNDTSVIDFCSICKLCAEYCPSRSIPFGEQELIDGAFRWKINADTCFRYWNTVGTDCGRCMAVCPYSHPDNWAHNFVRWGNHLSGAFRRSAFAMEKWFYGKREIPPEPGLGLFDHTITHR